MKIKYKSLESWKKAEPKAYRASLEKDLIEKICQKFGWKYKKIDRKKSGYWTRENCKNDALNYKTISEWQKKSVSAYSIAHRNNWLKYCCIHMSYKVKKPVGYWTLEKCKKKALKYKFRGDWNKNDQSSYNVALKNGWLDECCTHMNSKVIDWSEKKCIQSALKYNTKKDWILNDSKAYQASKRLECFEKCCEHFETFSKPNGYWSVKSNCKQVALECSSKEELKKKYAAALISIRAHNWFDELCNHFKDNKPKGYWNVKSNCIKAAKECNSPSEFKNKYGFAYKIVCKNNWFTECYKHMK